MVQYLFTPYRSHAELLAVRRQFYAAPGQEDEREKAVARVQLWMHRGACPHMIESTALLTAAKLSDEASLSSGGYAVRAAFSAAFSRFVTGLIDTHQDGQRKQSMYAVAKAVGLPATFVELRHQATHEQLPSLTRLRAAARKALEWIWEYYWRHLSDEARGESVEAALIRFLEEKEEEENEEKMKVVLRQVRRRFGTEEVRRGLAAISGEAIAGEVVDGRLLMRAVDLTRTLALEVLGERVVVQGRGGIEEQTAKRASEWGRHIEMQIERIREEVEHVEGHFWQLREEGNMAREEAEEPERLKKTEDPERLKKAEEPAWTRHVGPWTAKPIGLVYES